MPKEKFTTMNIELIDLSDDTAVAAAGTNTQNLQPAAGKIYEVIEIYANIPDPAGSSSGTHKLEFMFNDGAADRLIAYLAANTGSGLVIQLGEFSGNSAESPAAVTEQWDFIHHTLWATNARPIKIKYTNSTDVQQAQDRILSMLVKVYNERI